MLGSWLNEIQKTLDNVSGLAEKLEEFEGIEEKEGHGSDDVVHLSGSELNEVEGGVISMQLATKQKETHQEDSSTHGVAPSAIGMGDCCEVEASDRLLPPAVLQTRSSDVSCELGQKFDTTEREQGKTAVTGTKQTPVTFLSKPGERGGGEGISKGANSGVVSEEGDNRSLVTSEDHTHDSRNLQGQGGGTVSSSDPNATDGQLLRFQALLAEEMETSQRLNDENKRLTQSILSLQKEVNSLRNLKRSTVDKEKMASLEKEGVELSEQLGRERERSKQLLERKAEAEDRVVSLERQLRQGAADYNELQNIAAARQTQCEATRRQVNELTIQLEEKNRRVQELQGEVSRYVSELNHRCDTANDVVESLKREKEVFVSSLHRNQMEYELHIQQLEKKLLQAEHRADRAETRLVEHERGSLNPLRELRAALDDTERQKKQLLEEAALAAEECAALKRDHVVVVESYKQQLAGVQNELRAAVDERTASIQELLQWKGRHTQVQKELGDALIRAAQAEALNKQIKQPADAVCTGIQPRSGSRCSSSIAAAEPSFVPSQPLTPVDVCANNTCLALLHFHTDGPTSDVSRGGRERMEKELVRQAVEIESLRRYKDEVEELRKKLAALAAQHDLLMQMYGQLQEETQQQTKSQS
ncbi:hypothetical protein DPX39_000060500 [Trypanosoma brucei equiperdum]|uniref:Uncharacterized protein n=1 Tax=Trypanosoma brucei equiperdum TaxID=630700 RepID=A0A3L6KWD1_9TRYP|nr:hypothetical protein DPX39_000060500 [Trypanosoma brucei equiperdum]